MRADELCSGVSWIRNSRLSSQLQNYWPCVGELLVVVVWTPSVTRSTAQPGQFGTTRDGTIEPKSRHQTLRCEWGRGKVHFPCTADSEQNWKLLIVYVQWDWCSICWKWWSLTCHGERKNRCLYPIARNINLWYKNIVCRDGRFWRLGQNQHFVLKFKTVLLRNCLLLLPLQSSPVSSYMKPAS